MTTINEDAYALVQAAVKAGLIENRDERYALNQVTDKMQLSAAPVPETKADEAVPVLLKKLTEYAVSQYLIEDLLDFREKWKADLMNIFLPSPSQIQKTFEAFYEEAPVKATDYFYKLSKDSYYIPMDRIEKNVHFFHETPYGKLDITINLSKPEKDPKDIEAEKYAKVKNAYPQCLLCMENEGYGGRVGHPARSNHRLIEMSLEGEAWYLQYSPYIYYSEHSILLSGTHRDMVIGRLAFQRLLAFVEKFPHYFMGSNADLPIVGGSILSHDHYQGGRYSFALERAEKDFSFNLPGFSVEAETVKWPMSVIRLRSESIDSLVEASVHVLEKWKTYKDETRMILPFTGSVPHNTITPIARKKGTAYEIDLVLRNNRTTDTYPDGIFHPHQDVHHIKKENIGLIEVMGLAVLPKRLIEELAEIRQFIQGEVNTVAAKHLEWAEELKWRYKETNEQDIEGYLQKAVGEKFLRVLHDAGVFKRNADGQEGFQSFVQRIGR
ncbi:UTP-hexose-1-phosphate uridylyltransferase [Sinobaca qinghaiensis]|uniref:Galactose-1-phosphate uridylyltransferase n=1 Tax=Sinobaca qinghaiensis TaxID=342944 RepID=A0A419V7V6_9BACL|nr:UDP-glucose--hexose-1-phosphate uridylyltransferase [Sinobaca qinghaiensis]RKD76171.1 UTP-hexose-1-phosphate uridylyltransferase [Sinobaca qinghaiensis]